jgi:PST family polysaccharide transporter
LLPADFGAAAIVLTVYEFIALFSRNGIDSAVVRAAPEDVEAVAHSAYWLSWLVCGGLTLTQALVAIPAARAFGNPDLALPIALMGLIYLVTPMCNMQTAFLQREGRVGVMARTSAVQVVVDNLLSAIFALCGMGFWAIILPKLLVAPIWPLMNRYAHAWRPRGRPTLAHANAIIRYCRHIAVVEVLTTVQANIDNVMVGYFLGVEALGLYYFAFNAGLGITLGLVNSFAVAVFPHLCASLHDRAQLSLRFRHTMKVLGLIVVPLVILQSAAAPIYVPLIFGAKWHAAIPVLMLICLSALARPFASATAQLLRAVGRPDIDVKWQILNTGVLVTFLLIGSQINVVAVAWGVLLSQTSVLTLYSLRAPIPFIGRWFSWRANAPSQPAIG